MQNTKSILLVTIIVLISSIASAIPNFGTEIAVLPTATMKNMTYVYDGTWSWELHVETSPSISANDLVAKKMTWSAFDMDAGKFLFSFRKFRSLSSPYFDVQLDNRAEVAAMLKVQKKVLIVVAQENGTPVSYLDIGKFCGQYPSKVSNLTDLAAKACDVGDLNREPVFGCKEHGDRLADLLKNGLITCMTAEKQFAAGGGIYHPEAVNCTGRKFCSP